MYVLEGLSNIEIWRLLKPFNPLREIKPSALPCDMYVYMYIYIYINAYNEYAEICGTLYERKSERVIDFSHRNYNSSRWRRHTRVTAIKLQRHHTHFDRLDFVRGLHTVLCHGGLTIGTHSDIVVVRFLPSGFPTKVRTRSSRSYE